MATQSSSQRLHSIDAQHPSLPGHFPGEPVVPGVVILDTVVADFHHQFPQWEVTGVRKLKFVEPLLPQAQFSVIFDAIKDDKVRFRCLLAPDATPLAQGNLKVQNNAVKKEAP